jgi:polygalacturonase
LGTTSPPAGSLRPADFGAVGDGVTDDTAALQRALDAVPSGGTLWLTPGAVYAHSDLLKARVAGEHVAGAGILLATNESRSAFWITAQNVTVDDVTFRTKQTTKRWDAYEQMGVRLAGVTGTVLRGINVEGSAAAGIYVGKSCCTAPFKQSSDFLIENVSVSNTRADGIHITGGSHDGVVRRPTVSHSGDDGVAVVSYAADGVTCNHITIDSPTVATSTWGRGISVVGGDYITYSNVNITASNAAAVYVADEGSPYFTASSEHIVFRGGTLTNSNTNPDIGHGAILLWSARAGYTVNDVTIDGITIQQTRSSAPWQVGVRTGGGDVSRVVLSNITITGTVPPFATNVSGTAYSTLNWIVNGVVRPDHR